MLFPTAEFAIFFFLVFFISWQLKGKPRKLFLTLASYFFYGYWDWRFTLLLASCSIGNYFFGMLLKKWEDPGRRKTVVALSVVFNLTVLIFFKYFDFFTASFNNLFLSFGTEAQLPILGIILPVGISFFTFQAMSYVIDVYRKEIPPTESLPDLLLYISFFPQLVAGPIVRAKDFLPQLAKKPSMKNIEADRAFMLIVSGIFKKVIIANYLATLFVDQVFESPMDFNSLEVLFGVYGYAVQIYCDFSAYSDIAIGIAILLGYQFPRNFNQPYRAASIREFWRRWHISLSTWLRDYLYIPLGGSKKGSLLTYRNLMITMLLGGLWHGAAWNFFFWGLLHGAGLALERVVFGSGPGSAQHGHPIVKAVSIAFTFHFVCLSWIFFRSGNFQITMEYFTAFANFETPLTILTPFVAVLIFIGMAIHFIPPKMGEKVRGLFRESPLAFQGAFLSLFLILMGAMSPDGVAPFIYFQF